MHINSNCFYRYLILMTFFCFAEAIGQTNERPKLLVGIVVDQMIARTIYTDIKIGMGTMVLTDYCVMVLILKIPTLTISHLKLLPDTLQSIQEQPQPIMALLETLGMIVKQKQ